MKFDYVDTIRKLIIISLFTDDDLMDMFVLKGGNALNLIYRVNARASKDIDLSMESDFHESGLDLDSVREKIKASLKRNFKEQGYRAFDIKLEPRPQRISGQEQNFWGGYRLTFKVIEKEDYDRLRGDIGGLRRNALPMNRRHEKNFRVDISKYEYCEGKAMEELDDYVVYVYTPVMVVYEKLRAICQQLKEYQAIVSSHNPRPRARDFFDIHTILYEWETELDLYSPENLDKLQKIFAIKHVPLEFLTKIEDEREYHRDNFQAVEATVPPDFALKEYDYYFESVITLSDNLAEALGIV